MHAGFGAFLTPPSPLARKITSLLLLKLMYYARILATTPPPFAACILNQWLLTLNRVLCLEWKNRILEASNNSGIGTGQEYPD